MGGAAASRPPHQPTPPAAPGRSPLPSQPAALSLLRGGARCPPSPSAPRSRGGGGCRLQARRRSRPGRRPVPPAAPRRPLRCGEVQDADAGSAPHAERRGWCSSAEARSFAVALRRMAPCFTACTSWPRSSMRASAVAFSVGSRALALAALMDLLRRRRSSLQQQQPWTTPCWCTPLSCSMK
jgi:hypothetical protein